MSYKKNSKSRLARFMLALTIMGGTGQRLADNKSYAILNNVTFGVGVNNDPYHFVNFDYFDKSSGRTRVQNVTFDENLLYGAPGPVENGKLNDEAETFGRLMNCRLLEGGAVDNTGTYKNSNNYDVAKVKEACTGLFSDSQTGVLKAFIDKVGDVAAGAADVNTALGLLSDNYWNDDLVSKYEGNKVMKAMAADVKDPLVYIEKSKKFLKSFIEGIVPPDSNNGEDAPTVYFVMYNNGKCQFSNYLPSGGGGNVLGHVASKMSLDNFNNGFYIGYDSYNGSFLDQELDCNNNDFSGVLDVIKGFDSDFQGNFIVFEGSTFYVDNASIATKNLNPLSVLLAIAEYKKQKDAGNVNMVAVKAAYKSFDCALSHIKSKADLAARYDGYVKFDELEKGEEFKNYAVNKVWLMCQAIQGLSPLNSPINVASLLEKLECADVYERVSGVLVVICSGLNVSVFEAGDKTKNLVKFFKYLLGGNGDKKPGEEKKEKKSSVTKPILIVGGILTFIGVAGTVLWKTGYYKKVIDAAKEFFKKHKDRVRNTDNNSKTIGTGPAGKTNPVVKKPN